MPSFYNWIKKQSHRSDMVGMLAQDVIQDPNFPKQAKTHFYVREYLHRKHDASSTYKEALLEAFKEYSPEFKVYVEDLERTLLEQGMRSDEPS